MQDGFNGLVVDGHSVPAITEAMLRLREDTALRARIEEGALKAAQQAGWDRKAGDFVAVCLEERAEAP